MTEFSYVESIIIRNSDTILANILPLLYMVKLDEILCSIRMLYMSNLCFGRKSRTILMKRIVYAWPDKKDRKIMQNMEF